MTTPSVVLACIGGALLYAAMTGVAYRFTRRWYTGSSYWDFERWGLAIIWPGLVVSAVIYYSTLWLVVIPLTAMARITAGLREDR